MPFSQSFNVSWTQILQQLKYVSRCSMLVMFLRAICWLVGAFSVHIQPENELQEARESQTGAQSDIRLGVETL